MWHCDSDSNDLVNAKKAKGKRIGDKSYILLIFGEIFQTETTFISTQGVELLNLVLFLASLGRRTNNRCRSLKLPVYMVKILANIRLYRSSAIYRL